MSNLERAVEMLRRRHPRVFSVVLPDENASIENSRKVSDNRVCMWIHNFEFDLSRHSPFLRYNEECYEQVTTRYHVARERQIVRQYMWDLRGDGERDAKLIPALTGMLIGEEWVVRCREVKIVMVSSEDYRILWSCRNFPSESGASNVRVYESSDAGVRTLRLGAGGFEVVKEE